MIPDVTIREALSQLGSFHYTINFEGPAHKIYKIDDELTVLGFYQTGWRVIRKKSERMNPLVTAEDISDYKNWKPKLGLREITDRFNKVAKDIKGLFEGSTKPKLPYVIEGPLVTSHGDKNLETARAERILVRYDGIDLNEEYFDAPWWQTMINEVSKKYSVERADPQEGIPEYIFDREHRRGGLIMPHYHPSRRTIVFRSEATNEEGARKSIESVWKAGQAIRKGMESETKKLRRVVVGN